VEFGTRTTHYIHY